MDAKKINILISICTIVSILAIAPLAFKLAESKYKRMDIENQEGFAAPIHHR